MPPSEPPNSIPPETVDIDLAWADEAGLREAGDDPHPSPYERITVAPPVPAERYAADLMAQVPASSGASDRPAPRAHTPRLRPMMATEPEIDAGRFDRRSDRPRLTNLLDSVPPLSVGDRPTPLIATPGALHNPLPDDLELHLSEPPTRRAPAFASAELGPNLASDLSLGASGGDALDLVGARAADAPPKRVVDDPLDGVRDRFAVGDFSGALVLAEAVLEGDRGNVEAQRYAESCRDVLKQMYISRLGGTHGIPKVAIPGEQIRWLSLDHRSGFLLSLIDGMSSIDDILDLSGMPALDALRMLFELLQQNVIRVG